MPKIKRFIEKDNTGSQDQEEAPTAVGSEGFIPYTMENFEKQIQYQVTKSAQLSTGRVVGKTTKENNTDIFTKILKSFFQQ